MGSKKVSISLPEDLLKRVDEAAQSLGVSRSQYISAVLEEKLRRSREKPPKYPTVLWKLETSGWLRLRSPRHPSRVVGGKWVVEEVEE